MDILRMLAFERLEAWRACHRLVLDVYSVTRDWPPAERYGLTAQVRRAAVSAASNIAEGSAKRGKAEFRRYLDISVGSLSELAYHLLLARDLAILDHVTWQRVTLVREEAGRLTWRLYQSMR